MVVRVVQSMQIMVGVQVALQWQIMMGVLVALFRWPGQYEDEETGLYYNRFRYYDPDAGQYVSQDPIGLAGGTAVYAYVIDSNAWIDVFGLSTVYLRNSETYVGKAKQNAATRYGNKSVATDIFTNIPDTHTAQGVEQIVYERMKVMEASGDLNSMTNTNRPVDMSNQKKAYRRDLGEKWLKENVGENYKDVIDKKIKDHYQPKGMCK
jgi:RHS repeat-associated protein